MIGNWLGLGFASKMTNMGTRTGKNFFDFISIVMLFLFDLFVLFVYFLSMKTKQTGKTKQVKAAAPPSPETKPRPSNGAQVVELENPPPEYVLEEAMKEPDRKLVEDYVDSIRVLRDQKRFTFREISEWLKQYGVIADHNAIYRAYTKNMDERDAALVAMNDEEAERNGR